MAIMVLVAALVDLAWRQQRLSGVRVAVIDADGLESPLFNTASKRFGWEEIAASSVVAVQGAPML
ncbi:MAG TPA: hypothetical protein VNB23_03400, partial [Ramlibacter sp.]|nr:hypothetical protein [Ramlibacter sp.]